jgi:hypothetical protein
LLASLKNEPFGPRAKPFRDSHDSSTPLRLSDPLRKEKAAGILKHKIDEVERLKRFPQ